MLLVRAADKSLAWVAIIHLRLLASEDDSPRRWGAFKPELAYVHWPFESAAHRIPTRLTVNSHIRRCWRCFSYHGDLLLWVCKEVMPEVGDLNSDAWSTVEVAAEALREALGCPFWWGRYGWGLQSQQTQQLKGLCKEYHPKSLIRKVNLLSL